MERELVNDYIFVDNDANTTDNSDNLTVLSENKNLILTIII